MTPVTPELNLQAPDVLLHARPIHPTGAVLEQYVTLQDPLTQEEVPLDRLIHHSPSGLSYGYSGSGPSDLALNVLALHLPLCPETPRTKEEVARALGLPDTDEGEAAEAFWGQPQETVDALLAREAEMTEQLPVLLHDGKYVSHEAWALHHDLRDELIAPLDQHQSHVLSAETVRGWIMRHASRAKT